MVEINNQRKAFLDMLAWSEGTDNGRQKTRNHGYDVIVGGELLLITPITLANCHAKPKTQINGRRTYYRLLSRWWDAYRSSLAWKNFSPNQDAVALQQIERGAFCLWLIVVISVRQSTVYAYYLGFTAGRWLWSVPKHKADSLIAKFKEAGGTVRGDWCMSRVCDYLRSGYLHHRLPVMGC